MIVIDANVAAKWYVAEPGSADARSYLRQRVQRVAPSIIKLEVLGTITRTVGESRASAQDAAEQCDLWRTHLSDRVIEVVDIEELMDDAIKLSIKAKHHLYDCLYLVVCQRMNAQLVTYDEKLSKLAQRIGIGYEWLREPKPN